MTRALFTAVAMLLLAAPTASAQIHVDPDAPAGVQYGAPLDRAREQSGGNDGSAGAPGSTAPAPLFGEGVERAGKGGDGSGSGQGDGDGSSSGGGTGGLGSVSVTESDGGSTTPLLLGCAAVVLLAGAAGGFALRRAQ